MCRLMALKEATHLLKYLDSSLAPKTPKKLIKMIKETTGKERDLVPIRRQGRRMLIANGVKSVSFVKMDDIWQVAMKCMKLDYPSRRGARAILTKLDESRCVLCLFWF